MLLSRTRKEIKNMESFYKEAGLDKQIENMYEKSCNTEPLAKKDRVLLKKKAKSEMSLKQESKTNSDKLQSEASEETPRQLAIPINMSNITLTSSSQSTLPLSKMVNKISILQIADSKIVHGCYGHSTVIFKRPIIEGNYYLQFKILKPILNETKAKIKCPPSVRIGICPAKYSKNVPLGQDLSIGYKGSNGKLVYKGQEHGEGEEIKQGDVIGLCLSFSPPHKYLDQSQIWQESQIVLTKNGEELAKCSKIHQCFYCPAFSLYNYASIEVRWEQNSFEYCPNGYISYGNIFSEPVNYQFLKNTAEFALLNLQDK